MRTDIFVKWYAYSSMALDDRWHVVSDIPPTEDGTIAKVACHMQAMHIVQLHNRWLEQVADACGLNAIDSIVANAIEDVVIGHQE